MSELIKSRCDPGKPDAAGQKGKPDAAGQKLAEHCHLVLLVAASDGGSPPQQSLGFLTGPTRSRLLQTEVQHFF